MCMSCLSFVASNTLITQAEGILSDLHDDVNFRAFKNKNTGCFSYFALVYLSDAA